jgi:DNA topoisomerase-1
MYNFYGGGKNNGKQWEVFRHNGPYFPPEYTRHNIDIYIDGKKTHVSKITEEYLTIYAKYLDTEYIKKPRFNKNFLYDLKKLDPQLKINNMEQIDLSKIKKYLDNEKEKKQNMTKEEKEKIKKQQEIIEEPYKYCIINGSQQKVGNYKIEPPGIFLGRGEHPKLGRIKKRINPEDVIINLDKNAPIPKPNVDGKWKEIINDNKVIWLATWIDDITGKNKYIFTSMESFFKSKSDEKKFDLAKKLKNKVKNIRDDYMSEMKSDSETVRQLSTALYFIDNLALRVGGKKDTKEQADTVGVTSLRVEHIDLLPDNFIKLDFLGKDSVRFCKKIQVDDIVYENLKKITLNKTKKDDLFHKITATSLNEYLDSFMKGLTAKVWRTYNASYLFQKELDKLKKETIDKLPESERINYLITFFNQANTAVALLCNHQKAITTNIDKSIDKFDNMIDKLKEKKRKTNNKEKIDKYNAKIKTLKLKKETKTKMKNVSLGTSKTNYIDPRIIFSFMKKFNIPSEKLFTKQLLTRFEWASMVDSNYRF